MGPSRSLTFRVENIPAGTTEEKLTKYFYTEDQPRIQIRSIVPAVDSYELDIREYTATVTFQASNRSVLSPRLLGGDIGIDCDFHGFTPLNHLLEPIAADIIALTGLAAHASGSWAYSAQNMWLRDYLPRDVSNARILIYGYPSQLHGNISRSILSDHSTNMNQRLLTLPVRSIIFLGAPHKGLETTALETLVKSQATEDMIRELKSESPTLTELNDKFRHVAKDIDILTCYELSPTKTAFEVFFDHHKRPRSTDSVQMPDGTWKHESPPIMMVSLDSARQWYPREKFVACNADHSQIAKLKRGENSIYPSVRWAIKKALLSAGDLYSETKGIHYSESRHFRSVDEAPIMRRNLFEASHRQTSGHPMIAHQIQLQYRQDQSTHDGDIQFNKKPLLNETVSQWQSGIDVSKSNDTRSFSSPTDYAETDMASIVPNESVATSKSVEPVTSLGAEAIAPKKPKEKENLDSANIESEDVGLTSLQPEALSIATNGAKSMIFDALFWSVVVVGDEAKTRALLDKNMIGAELEATAQKRYTPLHFAACGPSDSADTVEQLLLAGAEKESTTTGARSMPLLLAVWHRKEACVAQLLKCGVNVNASKSNGEISLHLAAVKGKLEIVRVLLDHGANPTLRTIKYLGTKPSAMSMRDDVSSAQKNTIRALLKEAEKTWKQSGRK
ncbi:MAG: hypothetical protein Q9175_005624 [Cornicularia normoerica]